jgi:hypothetical protein
VYALSSSRLRTGFAETRGVMHVTSQMEKKMVRTSLRPALATGALTALLITGARTFAATVNYTADLKSSAEGFCQFPRH